MKAFLLLLERGWKETTSGRNVRGPGIVKIEILPGERMLRIGSSVDGGRNPTLVKTI
jgi:hypothetical protein